MKTHKNRHGLSLIEIMVAVAIIAILATITIGVVAHLDRKNNERKLESTFALLDGALGEYYEYWETFPDPNLTPYLTHSAALYGQLKATPASGKFMEEINEALIKRNPDSTTMLMPQIYDPWGTLIDYKYVPGNNFPKLISAGPDKLFNTIDDITNK